MIALPRTLATLVVALTLIACRAPRVPLGYAKPGGTRQAFFTDYSGCENGVGGPPILFGHQMRIDHCMEALGWQFGPTYDGFQP